MTDLVVLTTHFGTNFSGGSTATCKIFERMQVHFDKIVVVGTQLGEHPFDHLEFHRTTRQREAARILRTLAPERCVFYGDFFNAYIFTLCNIPFYFTYHDNWPELGQLSPAYHWQKQFYWRTYRRIFRKACHVFAVSELKRDQVSHFTERVSLVRNGVVQAPHKISNDVGPAPERRNILMVGNIDQRKYGKAAVLFRRLGKSPGFNIDIYGHINDVDLAQELSAHAFVTIKGFTDLIPYQYYRVLLHTSLMENLSIVWCEAILHRTPVLTFDIGAAREVICDDRGLCIPGYKLDLMHQALIEMVGKTEGINSSEASSLDQFQAEFNWDTAADRYRQTMFK